MHAAALTEIVDLIDTARRRAARTVNATMTAVYWLVGRRIVLEEQRGTQRAAYGEELIEQLARQLTARFGRGFGRANLRQMRGFYLTYAEILQKTPGESGGANPCEIHQTLSGESGGANPCEILHEAQATVRLKSEHVARVLDVGSLETGAPYMVPEYLEGTDLASYPRSQLDNSATTAGAVYVFR